MGLGHPVREEKGIVSTETGRTTDFSAGVEATSATRRLSSRDIIWFARLWDHAASGIHHLSKEEGVAQLEHENISREGDSALRKYILIALAS